MKMNKLVLICFTILALGVYCQKPAFKNALRNQVITDFKNAIVPIISKQIENLKLTDVHESQSGVNIDVENILIHIYPINPGLIGIRFVAGTSSIQFYSRGFSMHGTAHARAKWSFISKACDVELNIGGAGLDFQITLFSNGGRPNIRVDSISIYPGNIDIKLHGDIIIKIAQLIINLLKGHFIKEICRELQARVPPLVTKEVNAKLNGIPVDIGIGETLAIKYGFPYAPFVRGEYLYTGISAYIHARSNPNPPPYEPNDIPEFIADTPRGVQFFLSEYVLKSSVYAGHTSGLFALELEGDKLGHHIKMGCRTTQVPNLSLNGAFDLWVSAECSVLFDYSPTNTFSISTDIHLNLKENVRGAILYFNIVDGRFDRIEYRIDHPVEIEWFKNGINEILQAFAIAINEMIGNKGIPLPTIPGMDYTDAMEGIGQGYIGVGFTPVFHF